MSTSQRILHEASALFVEHGFNNTALSSIAAKLGVTKAALYYHYKSKDEMLLALVDPLLDHVDELLAECREQQAAGEADLHEVLEKYGELLVSDRRAGQVLRDVNVSSHPSIEPRMDYHTESLLELLINDDDPSVEQEVRAVSALSILQRGLIVHFDLKGRQIPMADYRELVVHVAVSVLEHRFDDD